MNLQNLNLVGLNAQEVDSTEGGNWFLVAALYIAEETLFNPKSSYNAFMAGYNS